MLDFRILGPIEVWRDGTQVALGGVKQRVLLALLLLEAGRVVATDRLIDALWGERAPPTAGASLQNLVSQLRKLLGPDVLTTKPPGYRLEIGAEQVDLGRFRQLVDAASSSSVPAERAAALREALALWRGDPLADLGMEEFAQGHIARLEELRLAALEQRIEADLSAGKHTELVAELEGLVAEHPLREGFQKQLMLTLYRAGRQAEALHVFHHGRRKLVDELGIEPSADLQRLHGSILRHDPSLDLDGLSAPRDHPVTEVVDAMLAGRLVPVLGADVIELATRLSERFEYPHQMPELPRVAQYVAVMKGAGPLHDELHGLLEPDIPPTAVHRFFAALPPLLRERGTPHQLIVTTSYDLALERAFRDAGEEFDVVSYIATGRNRGRFCHIDPTRSGTLIERPNEYATELSLDRRTVILKLHGQVDRTAERTWESFVITEDDYIGYLAQAEVANVIPVSLAAKLRRSHFLFLGYTMADWNLRLLLYRLWGDEPLTYRSWAVQEEARPFETEFWRRHDVNVVDVSLQGYVEALAAHAGVGTAEAVSG